DKIVKKGTWSHVTLKLNKTKGLSLGVYVGEERKLYWNDSSPLDIKYLNVRSSQVTAYFRIHKYSFLVGEENTELKSDWFQPKSDEQCWSIIYSIPASDSFMEVKVINDNSFGYVVKTLNETK
ncbi:hypothetical protein L9F63_016837, partial [Diploptera punctata]